MNRILLFLLSLLFATSTLAALERDLGDHIAYTRIQDLSTDYEAATKALAHASGIVDFRYTTSNPQASDDFVALLNRPESRPVKLRIFLVNEATDPRLREIVSRPRARQLTIGPARAGVKVDLSVPTSADEQRRAYDALQQGTPWEKLVSSNLEKRRFDEAALTRTHANGTPPAAVGQAAADDEEENAGESADADAKPAAEAPPLDYVLQRALQLQRAAPMPPR